MFCKKGNPWRQVNLSPRLLSCLLRSEKQQYTRSAIQVCYIQKQSNSILTSHLQHKKNVDQLFFRLHPFIIMNNINFIYPPDKLRAHRHRLASRIFYGTQQNQHNREECDCCGRKVGEEEVQTSCNIQTSQLSFLGPGAPLLFLFLRYIIYLLLIMVVVLVGFSIFSNVTSSDCLSSSSCIVDGFTLISIINKKSNTTYLSVQSYISLVFVLLIIFYFHLIRFKARKLVEQCDQVTNSPSDYSIILRMLPENTTQNDIRQAIDLFKNGLISEGEEDARKINVVKIILSYSLRDYLEIKQRNQEEFHLAIKQNRYHLFKPQEVGVPNQVSRIAIVVFQLQSSKDLFIYKPNVGQAILRFFCTACIPKSNLIVKGEPVGVERAPQPDQILWENSGITITGSICRKLLYGLIAIIILILGGLAQYGLQLLALSAKDSSTKSFLEIASSVIVTVFNSIILITLQITTKKQRAETLTEYQTTLMVKITMAQFFNAGIFVIIAQIGATLQTFALETSNMVTQISMIMILDAVIPNSTLFFLNYFEIVQRVKRFLIERGIIVASQKQLNDVYISPVIDLPNKYAYVLKTLWLTGLYAPMIPIVVVFALIGLTINYFLEKLLFTKCYSTPNTMSIMAFQSAVEMLQYFLISFAVGEFIIYAYFYRYKFDLIPLQWTITIAITVALTLLNSAIPMKAINQKIFKVEGSFKSQLKYSQMEQAFEVTYEMSNPAYPKTRKRKQNTAIHGFQSEKRKQKKEETELNNMMLNNSIMNNNISAKPLLKQVNDHNKFIQEVQSSKEQSPKLMLNNKKLQSSPISTYSEPQIPMKMPALELMSPRSAQKQLKMENHNQKQPQQKNQQDKKQAKVQPQKIYSNEQEIEKIKKKYALIAQQKALQKFKYLDIKQIKNKTKWNYQVSPTQQVTVKQEGRQALNTPFLKESALFFDPARIRDQPNNNTLQQNFNKVLGDRSNSRSSIMLDDPQAKPNAIFEDPVKEKKSTYDPIKLSGNYKYFFSDLQAMKKTEGQYLNKNFVMTFLGTPFSNLIKQEKDLQVPPPTKKEQYHKN